MNDVREIIAIADQYGPTGFYGKSESELANALAKLAQYFKDTELRLLSATWLYNEDGAKTEWFELEHPENKMRYVWIVKRVTRFAGMEFEDVKEENVMLVDRQIAGAMIELLRTQV